MKILILAGGTGSIQLQRGLFNVFSAIDELDVTVLVNAYDNGLSTGAVRKVCHGKILGPSDVRKNQTTRHELTVDNNALMSFLNARFTEPVSNLRNFAEAELNMLIKNGNISDDKIAILRSGLNAYLQNDLAYKIDYEDFSLSNIIYAGLASANGNSLRTAAKLMATVLSIPDSVILNDDTSLFLKAIAQDGTIIEDEGDIVNWQNADNPISNIFFVDADGKNSRPVLCQEAHDAIVNADIIIASSGTQWSSLIPTYWSLGFKEAYAKSNASKYLIMNKTQDKDMIGKSADDIVNIVSNFIDLTSTNVIIDSCGDPSLAFIINEQKCHNIIRDDFSIPDTKHKGKHNPPKLVHRIFEHYFGKEILNANTFVFDYDDTIVGRGNSFPKSSAYNKNALIGQRRLQNAVIVTGNTIKHVSLGKSGYSLNSNRPSITVFADGGINEYSYTYEPLPENIETRWSFIKCISPTHLFSADEITMLVKTVSDVGLDVSKIENRRNATFSIRPVENEYRQALVMLFSRILGESYSVAKTGRSTIDITKTGCDKSLAVTEILNKLQGQSFAYIGDEIDNGNDKAFVDAAKSSQCFVGAIKVKNPQDTAMVLKLLRLASGGEEL